MPSKPNSSQKFKQSFSSPAARTPAPRRPPIPWPGLSPASSSCSSPYCSTPHLTVPHCSFTSSGKLILFLSCSNQFMIGHHNLGRTVYLPQLMWFSCSFPQKIGSKLLQINFSPVAWVWLAVDGWILWMSSKSSHVFSPFQSSPLLSFSSLSCISFLSHSSLCLLVWICVRAQSIFVAWRVAGSTVQSTGIQLCRNIFCFTLPPLCCCWCGVVPATVASAAHTLPPPSLLPFLQKTELFTFVLGQLSFTKAKVSSFIVKQV